METKLSKARPASCTVTWINWAGLLALVLATTAAQVLMLSPAASLLLALGAIAATIILLESIFVKRPVLQYSPGFRRASTSKRYRFTLKMLGLACSVGVLAVAYSTFPIYRNGGAAHLIDLLRIFWVPLLACAPFYIWFVDDLMPEPEDGYFHVGLLAASQWDAVDWGIVKQHVLQWTVKGFFLPLVLIFTADWIKWLHNSQIGIAAALFWNEPSAEHWFSIYEFLYSYMLYIDCAFASVGFILTLRVFDAHVRSAEPTAFGWLVCMVCYRPFWDLFGTAYLNYSIAGVGWGSWLADFPALKVVWSVVILLLLFVYALCTVQFGIRFSNMTHRGILTNGPYRWFKHPQYLLKNSVMWFYSVPFISTGGVDDAIRASLLLAGINLIYYLRARTEERHLSRDPIYLDYVSYIHENGFFAVCRRRLARLCAGRLVASLGKAG